jgi:RES domain-containing protein
VNLWRIAAETREYSADDLSGAGAASRPGRWNDAGEPVVYCAPTIAMAVLETAAHIDDAGLPFNRFLVRIDVPDDIWAQREEVSPDKLSPTWAAIPAGRTSVNAGSAWLASKRSAVLLVPSVIVPEERVALVDPGHADAARIAATVLRQFRYHRLFRSH